MSHSNVVFLPLPSFGIYENENGTQTKKNNFGILCASVFVRKYKVTALISL